MPTYEYRCAACDHQFDQFQSITANPLRKCPACGKMKLHRLIGTGAGVIFKGSGFYETDYNRSSDYQSKAKEESGEGKTDKADKQSDTARSQAKSDSKSATKSTKKSDDKAA